LKDTPSKSRLPASSLRRLDAITTAMTTSVERALRLYARTAAPTSLRAA
jgi:hypothetical protein